MASTVGSHTNINRCVEKPLAQRAWLIEALPHTPGYKPGLIAKTLVATCRTQIPRILSSVEKDVLQQLTTLAIRIPETGIYSLESESSTLNTWKASDTMPLKIH